MPTPLHPPEYPDCPEAPLASFGLSFSEEIARSVLRAVVHEDLDNPLAMEIRAGAAWTMLEAFHPRDHLECMMAAQGVGTHCLMMDFFWRAMKPETPDLIAIKFAGAI